MSKLVATDIHKVYEKGGMVLPILRGLNLSVEEGEFVAIVGASGSGKSTLLHLLGGLDSPQKGFVEINGENFATHSERQRAQARNRLVGFVFQFHHLLPEFSALENVMMPGLIARLPRQEVRRKAEGLLGRVGLSERLHHIPSELSGGEQQRVAVARALINDPAVLLLDEPTGNLDRQTGDAVYALLLELNRSSSQSTVMVTHNDALAEQADRMLRIEDGVLVRHLAVARV